MNKLIHRRKMNETKSSNDYDNMLRVSCANGNWIRLLWLCVSFRFLRLALSVFLSLAWWVLFLSRACSCMCMSIFDIKRSLRNDWPSCMHIFFSFGFGWRGARRCAWCYIFHSNYLSLCPSEMLNSPVLNCARQWNIL